MREVAPKKRDGEKRRRVRAGRGEGGKEGGRQGHGGGRVVVGEGGGGLSAPPPPPALDSLTSAACP